MLDNLIKLDLITTPNVKIKRIRTEKLIFNDNGFNEFKNLLIFLVPFCSFIKYTFTVITMWRLYQTNTDGPLRVRNKGPFK